MLRGMWDLPGSGVKPVSPALAGRFFTTEPPGKPQVSIIVYWWVPILCQDFPSEPRLKALTTLLAILYCFPYVCYVSVIFAAAMSLQSCRTLCHPKDGSPPGSPVHGIFQASVLEWVAIIYGKYINIHGNIFKCKRGL